MKSLIWLVLFGATIFMPDEFNRRALAITVFVLCTWVLWSQGGFIWWAGKTGLIIPASKRLADIAAETSTRMKIPFREVLLMRIPVAQAFAFPNNRKLLFTERLLEIAPDDEIAAICAHELAHLTESRMTRYSRSVATLTFLPWIWFNPLTQAFGFLAFAGLLAFTILVPRFFLKLSRRWETRADAMAMAHEGDAGTYARALARLYQDNYLPAVTATRNATHPHLYDRMLAAGVTPDFPRPEPAAKMAWHGRMAAALMGGLFAIFVMRSLGLVSR